MTSLHGTLRPVLVAAIPIALFGCGGPAPAEPRDSDWRLIGGNEYEQHYSELNQINDQTVKDLQLAWFADMPTRDGLTGVPIVADGVVYQSGGLGKAWAHDVRTGKLLWTFDAGIQFPMDVIPSWGARLSRGLAIWEDKVLKATGDCRLFALDRKTGAKIWEAEPCDVAQYKAITGAPRVGDGKVFIGNSNADSGIGRGHVDAYDIATGKHLWRFYTIPGDPAKGFENEAMEMASKTWGKEYWKTSGGGSTWEGITYDPRTDLVYIGTDGPSPFAPSQRPQGAGDELFTNAIIAVKADTGEYVWHYSTTPGDGWNYSSTLPVVLADLSIDGAVHPVVMNSPKNGFFYVHDARTGKLLNEPKPIIPVNWASRIDMATGRPVVLDEAKYWLKGDLGKSVVSPSPMGARNWMPMSYSPKTGFVYIPTTDYPAELEVDRANLIGGLNIDFFYGLTHGLPFKGSMVAWDPVKQVARWRLDVGRPYQGGALSTAGNLVFQGTSSGRFNAYRADTGERLWSFETGSGILGGASTVEIGGEQMVLVAAGSGSTSSVVFAPGFSDRTEGPPRLLAFSLRGKAQLPPVPKPDALPLPEPPLPDPNAALARQGRTIWDLNGCELCHGVRAAGGLGSIPDVRRLTAAKYELFAQIVRGGLFKTNGMPVFADAIREDQLPALKAYILEQAWRGYREQQHEGAVKKN
ncbi:MAG: PQQ-dependent dehydrogenase, methanol/ethanol family [Dehalococcoidia bacterium]